MPLPDAKHPVWILLQSFVALAGLAVLVTHGASGGHAGGLDVEDGAGVGGIALASRLVWLAVKSRT